MFYFKNLAIMLRQMPHNG